MDGILLNTKIECICHLNLACWRINSDTRRSNQIKLAITTNTWSASSGNNFLPIYYSWKASHYQ